MTNGYNFYFDDGNVLTFPITPSELTIKVGSKNETVTLINEGEVNILKSPSLTEVEFEARFPMRDYPYARKVESFQSYFERIKKLKENKTPFRFIVARTTPNGSRTWDTNIQVALEDFSIHESADEGDDVLISFKLRQYKPYGVQKISTGNVTNTWKVNTTRSTTTSPSSSSTTYTVKDGDTLWGISKKFYGDGSKWRTIYNANKNIIEETAKRRWKSAGYPNRDSEDGHWIFTGTKLIIPAK